MIKSLFLSKEKIKDLTGISVNSNVKFEYKDKKIYDFLLSNDVPLYRKQVFIRWFVLKEQDSPRDIFYMHFADHYSLDIFGIGIDVELLDIYNAVMDRCEKDGRDKFMIEDNSRGYEKAKKALEFHNYRTFGDPTYKDEWWRSVSSFCRITPVEHKVWEILLEKVDEILEIYPRTEEENDMIKGYISGKIDQGYIRTEDDVYREVYVLIIKRHIKDKSKEEKEKILNNIEQIIKACNKNFITYNLDDILQMINDNESLEYMTRLICTGTVEV